MTIFNLNDPPVPEDGPDYGRTTPPPDLTDEMLRTTYLDVSASEDLNRVGLRVLQVVAESESEIQELVADEAKVSEDLRLAQENATIRRRRWESTQKFIQERLQGILPMRRSATTREARLGDGLVLGAGLAEFLLFLTGFNAMVPTGGGIAEGLREPIVLLGTLGVSFAVAVAVHQLGQAIAEIRSRRHLSVGPGLPTVPTSADTTGGHQ